MAKSWKSGSAEVSINNDSKMLMKMVNTVLPSASKIMQEELSRIEREAQTEWPRRQPMIRKDEQGNTVFIKQTSKGSWRLWEQGVKVRADGTLDVYLRNTAPYSFYIKFGIDSKNSKGEDIVQPTGKNVSQTLLIAPHRKTANKVVKALADDAARRL